MNETIPESMNALRLRAPGGVSDLVYERIDTPRPKPGGVLVGVHAAAITRGELEWPADRLPAIPSYEFSGVVVATASDMNDVAMGDEVYALTGFDRDGAGRLHDRSQRGCRSQGSNPRPRRPAEILESSSGFRCGDNRADTCIGHGCARHQRRQCPRRVNYNLPAWTLSRTSRRKILWCLRRTAVLSTWPGHSDPWRRRRRRPQSIWCDIRHLPASRPDAHRWSSR